MTTIVVARNKDQTVLGADSLLTQGEVLLTDKYNLSRKVLLIGNSVIGLAGSAAHYMALAEALKSLGDECRLHGRAAIFQTFTKLHKVLKDDFFLNPQKQADAPYEGNHISAMIANSSGIFGVYAHREILEFDRFWANGTGRGYALGAMYNAYQQSDNPVEVARAGLAAGSEFDRASGGSTCMYCFSSEPDSPPVLIETDV